MSEDMVLMYIEDNGAVGIFAYPASVYTRPPSSTLTHGLVEVPREQAERWAAAEAAWEAAQAEMRPILKARREKVLTELASFTGFEGASRAAARAEPRRGGKVR